MIENNLPVVIYTADGTATQWDISYQFSNAAEIALYISHNDVLTAIPAADYYVDVDNGTITYPVQAEGVEDPVTPVPQGDLVVIERANAITQTEDSTATAFKSADVERIADKLTKICQELSYRLGRTISYNPTVPDNEMVTDASEFKAGIEADTTAAIAAHNSSNTSHTDIRTLANNAMPKSGGTFTGNVSMANGTSINFPSYKIGENGSGNAIIGDNNGNGLVVLPNGEGAALFTNGGSEYSELVRFKDVKSTYSSSSTYPMDGIAVAQAVSGEAEARQLADAGLQGQITTLGTNKQDKLTDSQLLAVNSGIDSTKVSQIATNTSAISNETINRQNEDIALQGQIDALKAASDVADVVADYTELQNYDTSKLTDKALIKVLLDSTHNNAETYYRWSTSTSSFSYVGSAGASYTKAESDSKFLSQTSAASTYETIANVATGLAAKASNADNATIIDNGATISTVAVKEQRANAVIKKWVGTKAQYDAIATKDANTTYIVTDEDDSALLTVDSSLSSNSENPVQNKVIKTALDAKQNIISDLSTIRSGSSAGATAVQPSDLSTVATTGAYSDLSGTPTIPVVNNATITITQGGSTKGTFTLNQSTNSTIALDAGGGSSVEAFTAAEVQTIWEAN